MSDSTIPIYSPGAISVFNDGTGSVFYSVSVPSVSSKYINFSTDIITYNTIITSNLLTYSSSGEYIANICTLKYTFDQDQNKTKKYTI